MEQLLSLVFRHQIALTTYHWTTRNYAQHRAVGEYLEKLPDLQDTLVETWMGISGPVSTVPSFVQVGEVVPVPRNQTQLCSLLQDWIFTLEALRRLPIGQYLDQPLTEWQSEAERLLYLIRLA